MTLGLYAVYDDKIKAFMPPFTARTDAEAKRMFEGLVNTPDHMFARHPADFILFGFGLFDETRGQFDLNEAPSNIGGALQLIWEENQGETPLFTATAKPTGIGDAKNG